MDVMICVPIVESTKAEILAKAKEIAKKKPDMVELRIDHFEYWMEECFLFELLEELKEILGEIPILFTFRTPFEGGNEPITKEAYFALLSLVTNRDEISYIDMEANLIKDRVGLIKEAKEKNKKVITSYHNFAETPEKEEIAAKLKEMESLSGDVLKVAVMPNSEVDLVTLREGVEEANKEIQNPKIIIAMGELGSDTRIHPLNYSSILTFAMVGKESAPGQIEIDELRKILKQD
ncbi:3-dehydroquinate dehydratase-1 [Aequitasia blattaphilus]|uniref:3-dehydroquinate dehydratase n=1 Tax=Aequitasia blattaphilus TaxID=2949332 RepID=A0ABT1E5V0_9FIRM|nr:type I 3-dehydroquinate dehydratase [Aequitasia blattaphilus]MCP1101224.1 type I 3-dehydroquinate dehydratase [Aequitasia blattaphilus]MCR8613864.1 type I 3-dehydroquinate dehydratase [Aequitasia blattaphilus]